MKRTRWILLAAPLLLLSACGGEEEGEQTEGTAADTEAMAPAATDTATPSMATQVQLAPANNSGASGQATITHQGEQLQVEVQLTGLQPGAHAGHIHQGSCASLGAVVAPLPEVTADAGGAGSATTTVALSADSLSAGQHVIAYHQQGGNAPGAPVACGEIVMHQM